MKFERHAVLPAPTAADVDAAADFWKVPAEEALRRLWTERRRVIEAERNSPLTCGWEPPMWMIPDILMNLPCASPVTEDRITKRFGMSFAAFSAAVRNLWGFVRPVRMCLILGANRSAKTEFGAKRTVQQCFVRDNRSAHVFHESHARSVRDHQSLVYKYFPPDWRVQEAGEETYIKYKRKTGFSGDSFIAPNGSECVFGNYMQDRDTALQGIERDWIWPDELVLEDWLNFFMTRLATRGGCGVPTFTPVNGFTPAVQLFCAGGTLVQDSVGYLLPRDGGAPDVARQLGLTPEELAHLHQAEIGNVAANVPESRPEDVCAWFDGRIGAPAPEWDVRDAPFGMGHAQLPMPKGREFERVPRVMRCVDPLKAVVWFHSGDNPYGNPKNVVEAAMGKKKGSESVRIECYGWARKTASAQFSQFASEVHVVPDRKVPVSGRNVHVLDPAGDRNFFMGWMRTAPGVGGGGEGGKFDYAVREYVYREWPSGYGVPRVGVPEAWAIPSGRRDGVNDGEKGRGQDSFGWGLLRYKFEIARLEGWEAFLRWRRDACGAVSEDVQERMVLAGEVYPHDAELMEWDARPGAREGIEGRIIDSRSGSNSSVGVQRPVTILEDFADIGLVFEPAPGSDVGDGVGEIQTALDWQEIEWRGGIAEGVYSKAAGDVAFSGLAADVWRRLGPRLYVAESCVNTRFSLEYWMNVDGQKGACKDPIDILRMYFTSEYGGLWRLGPAAAEMLRARIARMETRRLSTREGLIVARAQVPGDKDLRIGASRTKGRRVRFRGGR